MSREATMNRDVMTADDTVVGRMEHHVGEPEYTRRLADKILSAFNHAYASGQHDIARDLRAALVKLDERVRTAGPTRRAHSVVEEADRWVAFVQARDRYKTLSGAAGSDPSAVGQALTEMKSAFKLWCQG
jgi:hypothetical protein